jgi:hypothetical protein
MTQHPLAAAYGLQDKPAWFDDGDDDDTTITLPNEIL